MHKLWSAWARAAGATMIFAMACSPLHAATDRLPDDAVLVQGVAVPEADAQAAQLLARIAAGQGDGVVASLDAVFDPVRREAIAARLLDRAQQAGMAMPATVLDAIAAWPVRVYTRHEETAADWFVPVFDLPGRVASLRLLAARDADVRALQAALSGNAADDATAHLAAADPRTAAQAVATLPAIPFAALQRQAKATSTPLPSPVLTAIARRTADADGLLHAIADADPVDVLPLFASTVPTLPFGDAQRVLADAMTRPAYASAAAFALVQRGGADDALHDALASDRTGASVAAALAHAPDALARIDALLASTDDAATLTHLALALRLQGSDDATKRLHRLRDDPRLPAHVRAELAR